MSQKTLLFLGFVVISLCIGPVYAEITIVGQDAGAGFTLDGVTISTTPVLLNSIFLSGEDYRSVADLEGTSIPTKSVPITQIFLSGADAIYYADLHNFPPEPEFTITAFAGAGGSIVPNGVVNVTKGATQTFSITPDTGYRIADVIVNGSSQGTVSSYTFTDVQTNHTISATFSITPPASITNLHNTSYEQTSITWAWTDPSSDCFAKVMVYLDGIFQANVTKGVQNYSASSLAPDTQHTIWTHSVGTSGLINQTWVNQTARTAPVPPEPPASVTNLRNTTYLPTSIRWNWTDPASADFDHVAVYVDGMFKANVTKGNQTYIAPSLTQATDYTISTHTVGKNGLVNQTSIANTSRTAPEQAPIANFTVNRTSGIPPLSVQFTDHSTGTPPLTYEWDFDDGSPNVTSQNPVHVYTAEGDYWPKLTVTNTADASTKVINEPIVVRRNSDVGYYLVHCNVNGAGVFLDDSYKGMIENGTLLIQVYTTGTPAQTYTVEKEAYQTFTAPVTEYPGKDETVDLYAELVPSRAFLVNLSEGWNLFSTPILLDSGQESWEKIFNVSGQQQIEIVLGWNGQWYVPEPDEPVEPLDGYYMKVITHAQARLTPSDEVSTIPSRYLGTGVSLVGPAPAYTEGAFPAMPLNQALISIEQTPGGLPGYVMVISPGHNQPGWGYAKGGTMHDLLPYKGYWIVMENPDTLYGFSTTPI